MKSSPIFWKVTMHCSFSLIQKEPSANFSTLECKRLFCQQKVWFSLENDGNIISFFNKDNIKEKKSFSHFVLTLKIHWKHTTQLNYPTLSSIPSLHPSLWFISTWPGILSQSSISVSLLLLWVTCLGLTHHWPPYD